MGLAAFNRMRIRQIEKMKPENILKEQAEQKKEITKEEQPQVMKRKPKNTENE